MVPEYGAYQGIFGGLGKVPEGAYPLMAHRSKAEINRYITVKFDDIPESDEKQLCLLEVMEALYEAGERAGIQSENTDGYSVTYKQGKADIYPIIRRYLPGYIYRGAGV